MSTTQTTPVKRRKRIFSKSLTLKNQQDNNNVANKLSDQTSARNFALWYKRLMDHERFNIGSYIADNAVLEWFGRTIRTCKKVVGFLKYDMQCSCHDFTTIESKDKVTARDEKTRTLSSNEQLASPLSPSGSPDINPGVSRKRLGLRSCSKSPQWETDKCSATLRSTSRKRAKTCHSDSANITTTNITGEVSQLDECMKGVSDSSNRLLCPEQGLGVNNKGDGLPCKVKRMCAPITPPNKELGQGDCLPSTSGSFHSSWSDKSHTHFSSQLPRKAVECNGYIELSRSKNGRSLDSMKWERRCKLQISYSQNPVDVENYVLWEIYYRDDSKCRRNLMAAFDEVSCD